MKDACIWDITIVSVVEIYGPLALTCCLYLERRSAKQAPSKRCEISTNLHVVTDQKTSLFVRGGNIKYLVLLL